MKYLVLIIATLFPAVGWAAPGPECLRRPGEGIASTRADDAVQARVALTGEIPIELLIRLELEESQDIPAAEEALQGQEPSAVCD